MNPQRATMETSGSRRILSSFVRIGGGELILVSNSRRVTRVAGRSWTLVPPPEVARHDRVRLWLLHYAYGADVLQGRDAKIHREWWVDSLSTYGS